MNRENHTYTPEVEEKRQNLTTIYDEIHAQAVESIVSGGVVENPLFQNKDPRYGVMTVGLIRGEINTFLQSVVKKLRRVEPAARLISEDFLHLTFREIVFNDEGRAITAQEAKEYYNAVRKNFVNKIEPINLELYKVILSLEREQPSVSVIASFLPVNNLAVYHVRKQVREAIPKEGLELTGKLESSLMHSTIARLPQAPQATEGRIKILDVVDEINRLISRPCKGNIDEIDMVSTTPLSYVWTDKHVFFWPPIALSPDKQRNEDFRFLKPSQRII